MEEDATFISRVIVEQPVVMKTSQEQYDELIRAGKNGERLSEEWYIELVDLAECIGKSQRQLAIDFMAIEAGQQGLPC